MTQQPRPKPITASGFVDGAPVIFSDVTSKTGLDKFHHKAGTPEMKYILEAPSGGVALFDYDNDGWLDIYLVNGSTYPALKGKERAPKAALFHNNHDGTFTDVTDKAGMANERWGFGVAVGDYDNDGWEDLFVTNFGKSRLYHNNGNGTFTDVAEKAGITVGGWPTGAAFGDYDGDGKLDLFVAGYVDFDPDHPPVEISDRFCQYRSEPVMCGPRGLPGASDHLFHNSGNGTFTDVSAKAGVQDKDKYYGFGVGWIDFDGDGKLDLIVINDSTPNLLYHNNGDGTFTDVSYASGAAVNENGREQAGMGLAIGDYDNDGLPDLYITTFSDDTNTLFHNDGGGNFSDLSSESGAGEPTKPFLGWGTGFIDYDNDGLKDLFMANGHVYPVVDKFDWGTSWAERPLLMRNTNGKRFEVVPAAPGSGLAVVKPARGAAFGDLDNDGRIDIVLNNVDTTPTVLHNEVNSGNHWLTVKLIGGPKIPRDAIGATVYCTTGNIRQRGDVLSGTSYASQSDLRVHFGLGKATKIDKLEIRWPDGKQETISVSAVDQFITITQDKGITSQPQRH